MHSNKDATRNKCHASSNRCLTSSNKKLGGSCWHVPPGWIHHLATSTSETKKLVVTSATLVVTGAFLVVTRSASSNKCHASSNRCLTSSNKLELNQIDGMCLFNKFHCPDLDV